MANVFLAWQNRIDSATLSGGSWSAGLPLANLQSPIIQRVARTANATLAATQFRIDLGAARPVGVVALLAHTISQFGRVRVFGYETAGYSTVTYDSGWLDCYPPDTLAMGQRNWEDDNFWTGELTAGDLIGLQSPFVHVLPREQFLRWWEVDIDDTTNAAGCIDIGRCIIARGWRPGTNYAYGAEINYFDSSPSVTTLSGTMYFDARPKGRMFRFAIEEMTTTEAYSFALDLQRQAGLNNEVLLVPDSDDTGNIPLRAFAGRLTALNGIGVPDPTRFTGSFELKEII
jgi:hypothetical protein